MRLWNGRGNAKAILADFIENGAVGLHWVGPDGTILDGLDRGLKAGHSVPGDRDPFTRVLFQFEVRENMHLRHRARLVIRMEGSGPPNFRGGPHGTGDPERVVMPCDCPML